MRLNCSILAVSLLGCCSSAKPPAPTYTSEAPPVAVAAPPAVVVAPSPMTPHAPVACSGADAITLRNVVIDAGVMPAIAASGSCAVTIEDSRLSSSGAAVAASGSSRVLLARSAVSGSVSLAASGAANVTSIDSTLQGATSITGSAVVDVR